MQLTEEIQKLFKIVRSKIGGNIRQVELDDNTLMDLLDYVIQQYDVVVQSWIIEANWLNMLGKSIASLIQNPQELSFAMTFGCLDFSKDYSQWFSRDVGLQQRGTKYELKKDFFIIEQGKQCYLVPAGREINKVLWVTPSTTKVGMMGTPLQMGGMLGYGVYGDMFMGAPRSFLVGGLFDCALTSVDIKNKNKFLRGDLTYKVTALETGEHIIHLMSVPGSPNQLRGGVADDSMGWNAYAGCECWYYYYDVGTNQEDIDDCRRKNNDRVILTPDQIPMNASSYELMNPQGKGTITQLLLAEAMQTIGLIRGYASGVISIPDAQMTLDYNMLLNQGKDLHDSTLNDLKERLQRMLPANIMKNYADMSDSLMNILKNKPLGMYVI